MKPVDFSLDDYVNLLKKLRSRFETKLFGENLDGSGIAIWRHDIDFSPHRALKIANANSEHDIRSVFYVQLSSRFYNVFEPAVLDKLKQIASLEHQVGLHYECDPGLENQIPKLVWEADTLSNLLNRQVQTFSIHNPGVCPAPELEELNIEGLINGSASALRIKFEYCSDSNGVWRYRRLEDVLDDSSVEKLYALTHPVWWQGEGEKPRQKIERSVQARASRDLEYYDALLQSCGRPNTK